MKLIQKSVSRTEELIKWLRKNHKEFTDMERGEDIGAYLLRTTGYYEMGGNENTELLNIVVCAGLDSIDWEQVNAAWREILTAERL